MLNNPPITGITKKISNLYTLVMAVAKRARQVTDKDRDYNISTREKAVTVAAEDVYAGNVIVLNSDKLDNSNQ